MHATWSQEGDNTEPPTQEIAPEALESQTENPPATEEDAEEEGAPQTGVSVCANVRVYVYVCIVVVRTQ